MNDVENYIRQKALALGLDPEVAVRVANAEALRVFRPDQPDRGGDESSSFGPFQLHYAGLSPNMPNAGMGDDFTRATGLDARDPSTWPQQVDFALAQAKKGGWSPWMGAKAAGVGEWEGITGGQPTSALAGLMSTVPTAAPQNFSPAFGDLVAANPVQTTPFGDDMGSIGLNFLKQAEKRREKEEDADRERRRALFAQPVVFPTGGLGGLYG